MYRCWIVFFVFSILVNFIFGDFTPTINEGDIAADKEQAVDSAWEAKINRFQQDLVKSVFEIMENNRIAEKQDDARMRKRRSLPIDADTHHSYIYDQLPDRINELFLDGANVVDVQGFEIVKKLKYLPVYDGDGNVVPLVSVFDELANRITFHTLNYTGNVLTNASVPFTGAQISYGDEQGTILHCTIVTKKVHRLDLERLMIVVANIPSGSLLRVYKIDNTLPDDPNTQPIYSQVSLAGLDYKAGITHVDFSATVGKAVRYSKPPHYRVWTAAILKNGSQAFIDVHSIEKMNGKYRFSTRASYKAFSPSAGKVLIFPSFQYLVILEYRIFSQVFRITYFVEKTDLVHPQVIDYRLPTGFLTAVQYFEFGSRSFLLIGSFGPQQYIKEIVLRGTTLVLEDFDVINLVFGSRWLVIDVPGCRDEKLIYLVHNVNNKFRVSVFQFMKTGLVFKEQPDTNPVYYLTPDFGSFDHYGDQIFDSLELAREECLNQLSCVGVEHRRGKRFVLGFLSFIQGNESDNKVLVKKVADDGADLHVTFGDLQILNEFTWFSFGGTIYFFVDLGMNRKVFAKLITHLEPTERRIVWESAKIYHSLRNLTAEINEQEVVTNRTKEILMNAVDPVGDQSFFGNYTFVNLTGNPQVSTEFVNAWNVTFEGSTISEDDLNITVAELDRKITELHDQLKEIVSILEDAVFTDEDANITGKTIIEGIVKITEEIEATELRVHTIANTDISELLNTTFRRDNPVPIEGKTIFNDTVTVLLDVFVQTLNGLTIKNDILQTNIEQVIHGKTNITKPVYVNGYVNVTTVNGIDIGEEAVPLDSNKTIVGEKVFTKWLNASTVNVLEHGLVDNVPVSKTVNNVLTVDGSEKVKGNLTFVNTLTVLKDVEFQDGGSLSGVDVSELYNKTALITDTTTFTGDKVFSDEVHVYNEIILSGYLNGLNTNDLFTKLISHYITAYKHFYFLIVNEMHVDGYVSGYDLPSDVVTLTTNQTIEGKHYFLDGITVLGDIKVNGTVDGVNISEFENEIVIVGNETVIQGNITFYSNVTVAKNLTVDGMTNEDDLSNCYDDAVFDSEENVTIEATKNFTSSLNCSGKFVVDSTLNDFLIPEDFVDLHSDQNITGHKKFTYVKFNVDLNVEGLIDGVNITDLQENALTLSTDQEISSRLNFTGGIHLSGDLDLTENNTVDGIDVSDDLVFRYETQTITGYKIFFSIHIRVLRVFVDIICDNIDGVDISELALRRVTLQTYQDIHVPWLIGNDTVINELVVNSTVNGIILEEFVEDIMSLTQDQWVNGSKDFTGELRDALAIATVGIAETESAAQQICLDHSLLMEDCKIIVLSVDMFLVCDANLLESLTMTNILTYAKSTQGINGFGLKELSKDAVKIFNDSTITGNFTFDEDFWVTHDIHLSGLIDGVNLTEIDLYAVRKQSSGQNIGNKTFVNGFFVYGNISVGVLGGFLVPNDTLTVNTDQVITAEVYKFQNTTTVNPEVYIVGLITACTPFYSLGPLCTTFDLSELVKYIARIDKNITITTDLIFKQTLVVSGDVILTGYIDGVDLSGLNERVLSLNVSDIVNGTLTLISNTTIIFSADLLPDSLNGIDFAEFVNKTLRIDRDESVFSEKNFTSHVVINGKLKADDLIVGGLVDGVDIIGVYETAVFLDSNETLKGTLTFGQKVIVTGDVYLSGDLNGVDIGEDVVTTSTDQTIHGDKTLVSVHSTVDVNVTGLVNGYYLPDLYQDTLMIRGDQIITGHKRIETADFSYLRCMSVNHVSTGTYVTLNTDQEISGPLTFTDNATINYLYVKGYINGENINQLWEDALFKDRAENVTASHTFKGDVIFVENVTVADNVTVDSVDLSELQKLHEQTVEFIQSTSGNLTDGGKDVCVTLNSISTLTKDSAFYVDYWDHPYVRTDVVPFSHIVSVQDDFVAMSDNPLCIPFVFPVVFDLEVVHNTSLIPRKLVFFPFVRVSGMVEDSGFILVYRGLSNTLCLGLQPLEILYDFNTDVTFTYPTDLTLRATQASLIVSEPYLYVSIVYNGNTIPYSTVRRFNTADITDNVKLTLDLTSSAQSGYLVKSNGDIFYVQVEDKPFSSKVYVSRIILENNIRVNEFEFMKLDVLTPVYIGDKVFLASYRPTKKDKSSYTKFEIFPAPSTFTLYRFDSTATAGNPSLVPVQSLSIKFKKFQTFTVMLSGVSINYALFINDKSVDIYEFRGVKCYEKTGVIDLAPTIDDDEFISVCTVSDEQLPAIVLQTNTGRLLYYGPVVNGFSGEHDQLECHPNN